MAPYKRGGIWWYKFYFAGQLICESSKSTSKTVAKGAEQQRRRELETGFHDLKEVRQQRIRGLRDIIAEYLVGYRLRYRSATFAEYALGHVSRLLGGELVVDINEATVLGYQESRLREKASPKSINEEVRFLLKMMGDSGELIRVHLRTQKQLKLAVSKQIGKAFDSEETENLTERAKESKSPHMYPAFMLARNAALRDHFYRKVLGAVKLSDPENPQGVRYALSDTQFIEVLPLPVGAGINRLDHSAWNTDNAEQLRRYLAANKWKTPDKVEKGSDGSRWFEVFDPEGNKVQFVQLPPRSKSIGAPDAIGNHIIHIGFLVHSQESEDKFYRTLLDFCPYWWGGRKKGQVDWVSQQSPDSPDWLEYMLVADPGTGIPANMSKVYLGVLDHFSIGQTSVDDTLAKLKESGRLIEASHPGVGMPVADRTQVGLDGKGQYNLFDPDGIRVEFMNFHHITEPCCSPFTAPDPSK